MHLSTPNNYLVVRIQEKNYIVDTGSPVSFNYSDVRTLVINGTEYQLNRLSICPKDTLDKLTGLDIDGIIGLDILRQTGLTIDLENMTLSFSCADCSNEDRAASLSFDYFMGQYLVTNDVFMGRQLSNAIIDTGAPIPYISARLASLFESTGEAYEDLSPLYGVLQGEYLKGELVISGSAENNTRSVKIGLMPQAIDMFGIFDAILGVTSLSDKLAAFDFRQNITWVKL